MNPYLEKFRDYSTEYLLERRALGKDGLNSMAFEAIELLLVERGAVRHSRATEKTPTGLLEDDLDKLNNFPSGFDPILYQRAKPLFQAAISNLENPKGDIREVMRQIVRMMLDRFGREGVERMRPYVVRFIADVRAGEIKVVGCAVSTATRQPASSSATQNERPTTKRVLVTTRPIEVIGETENGPGFKKKLKQYRGILTSLLILLFVVLVGVRVGSIIPETAHVVIEKESQTYLSDRCVSSPEWAAAEKITVSEARQAGYVRNKWCREIGGFAEEQMLLLRLIFGSPKWK